MPLDNEENQPAADP